MLIVNFSASLQRQMDTDKTFQKIKNKQDGGYHEWLTKLAIYRWVC